jgi:nitrite reductase (NADH) small subunit
MSTDVRKGTLLETGRQEGALPDTGPEATWVVVCPYGRLEPERGVAALVGRDQVAIFLTQDGNLYAMQNYDPYARAYVLSRGIVGTRGDVPTVASPMHKQSYDLRTGVCLDLRGVAVRTYEVRCRDGLVEVRCPS